MTITRELPDARPAPNRAEPGPGPLSGVRVLDLGRMMAGPYCGSTLAMMGAEVIKIENEKNLDSSRTNPPGFEGILGLNRGVNFSIRNVNKKSFLVDLSKPQGKALFLDLARVSDVVLENFRPGVMDRLKLGYDDLRKVRPDIILASLSGFGTTGPERDYLSYATVVEGLAGLAALNGFPGGPPYATGPPFPDFFMGAVGAFAIVAALVHRDRTGEGQFLDIAQLESTVMLFPDAVLDWEVNGRVAQAMGNQRDGCAPSGVFQCAGNDRWVAIDVATDEEWHELCEALGQPRMAKDPDFMTVTARWAHLGRLNGWLQEAVRERDAEQLFHMLQERGLTAGIAVNVLELLRDPHLQARGVFQEVDHPVTRTGPAVHVPWRLSETPSHIARAAPLFGEHTHELLHELLGMGHQEIETLEKDVVLA